MNVLDEIPQVRAAKVTIHGVVISVQAIVTCLLIGWAWWTWHSNEKRAEKIAALEARTAAIEATEQAQRIVDQSFANLAAAQQLAKVEQLRQQDLDHTNTTEATRHDPASADFVRLPIPQRLRDADAATRAHARLGEGPAAGGDAHPAR